MMVCFWASQSVVHNRNVHILLCSSVMMHPSKPVPTPCPACAAVSPPHPHTHTHTHTHMCTHPPTHTHTHKHTSARTHTHTITCEATIFGMLDPTDEGTPILWNTRDYLRSFAVLGYHTVQSCSLLLIFMTAYLSHLQGSSFLDCVILEDGR
jgi:hypothetical protein